MQEVCTCMMQPNEEEEVNKSFNVCKYVKGDLQLPHQKRIWALSISFIILRIWLEKDNMHAT